MATNPCDICETLVENPDFTISTPEALREIIKLLCAASATLSEISDPTPLPITTVTFGAIGTSYPGSGQIDVSPDYYRSVTVANSTNEPVLMSVDGNLTILTVAPGTTATIAVLRASQLFFRSVVAPTSGNVRVTGY